MGSSRGLALCRGHGLGFLVVDRSARAGGRGLVFGCQGACGLRPPCVACFVPSCACRLRPGSRPAIIPAASLPCGPWAGLARVRCSRLHAQHNSVFPICQALFCKKISVRPITPLRGVKKFPACPPGRNDPALCTCVIPHQRGVAGDGYALAVTVAPWAARCLLALCIGLRQIAQRGDYRGEDSRKLQEIAPRA